MIHYSCDLCKRELDREDDGRYVVKIELYQAFDPSTDESDDERDYLQEIHEMIERRETTSGEDFPDDTYRQLQFDLCPECFHKFSKNPLGRDKSKQLDFSKN